MRLWAIALPVVLGLVLLPFTFASADESKPLKQMLVEKGVITKEDAATVQDTVFSSWVDWITFSGDLRIRDSQFFDDNNANGAYNNGVNQNRLRFRLRLATELKLGDVAVGVRLASGTGQQTGTNQTETALFTGKALWIDQAYLSWQGSQTKWLKVTAGKLPNPFFVVYSGNVVWDEDVNPEGFSESFKGSPAEHVNLFFNAGQFVLNELGTNNHDPWMLGEQGGISVEPTSQVKTTLAAAFYESINASGRDSNPLGGYVQQGNTRSAGTNPPAGTLLNNYRVLDSTALVNVQAGPIPIALMGDYVRNLANTTTTGMASGKATGNEGYQLGAIVGKAAEANTWEVAYFYKLLQTDATLADLTDSDFGGSGGTARRGHIVWGAYNFTKYAQIKLKYFMTKSITPVTTAASVCGGTNTNGCGDVNRLQADILVKF